MILSPALEKDAMELVPEVMLSRFIITDIFA
jgi:hypothetical protein